MIFGAVIDDSLGDEIRIIAIATGFGLEDIIDQPEPNSKSLGLSWSRIEPSRPGAKKIENSYSTLPS